jgi:polyisoprenoid-binding protein YceI
MSQATQYTVPAGAWSADKIHSTVGFAAPLMAGSFQGTFSDFDARLNEGALLGTAEVASVEVKDPNLGGHFRAPTSSTQSASRSSPSRRM